MPEIQFSHIDEILLFLLIGVLGWIGAQVHLKIEQLGMRVETKMDELNTTLVSIERDLRSELTHLDRRVTKVETHHLECSHRNDNERRVARIEAHPE